jgi:co-chaperonin GroES (HSP10)
MGPMAYQPLEKFGGEPHCKVGDWVIYSSYERDEIYINEHLCFFLNDERIYATIPDISTIVKELEV